MSASSQPTFVQRVRNSRRFTYTHIDVLAHRKSGENSGGIEISVQCGSLAGTQHVTVVFTPEDSEVLIEAIRKAIDVARMGSVE